MATIHRRKESKFWYCSFRIPQIDPDTGEKQWKQFLRNTKQTEKKEAEKAATAIEEATRAEYGAGEEKSRKLLAVLRRATEEAAQGLLTESVARQRLTEIAEIAGGETLRVWTIRAWLNEWLVRKERTVKPATYTLYRLSVESFLNFLGERADHRIEAVGASDVRTWRDQIRDEGRTGKTVGQYQKSLSGALRAAAREGILLRNPAEGLEYLPKEDSTRREPFAADEVKKLIDAAPEPWGEVITVGFYSGLRLRDITNLRWENIDLVNKVIHVEPMKQARKKEVKKRLAIPMHNTVLETLLGLKASDNPKDFLFPGLAGKPSGGKGGLSWQFSEIMDAAKVDPMIRRTREEGEAGRKVSARGFHSLRHTFVSALANGNVSPELRRELSGHSDADTHAIYTHHDQERLRGAVDQLPELG